jgi:transcription initiation factor TFIID TATA-box-binding protein
MALGDASYNPESFPGLIYRRKDPRSTIIVFANGKFVSIGTTSERESRVALRLTLDEICLAEGKRARMGPVKTVNLVATSDWGHSLDLFLLNAAIPEAVYEPELFPGMILHNSDRSALLLFGSGKVVCSGSTSAAKARWNIEEARRKVFALGFLGKT